MKKTVLYLMNGFGIEQRDSYPVYNSNLMPNLDSYTHDYLFSTIETNAFDMSDGYRYFSTGSKYALTYPLLDQFSENFDNNPNLKHYLERLTETSNMHLFCFLENYKSLEQLKTFLIYLRSKTQATVFLHLILDSKDNKDYQEFEKIITKMSYDLKDFPIYTVVGKNILVNKSKDYVSILNHGIGEKWREIGKKFTSLFNSNTEPVNTAPFFVNDTFTFNATDQIFFWNYSPMDLTNFMNDLNKYNQITKSFSMFPIKGVPYAMFAYPVSSTSMAHSLESIQAKGMVLTNPKYINMINYYGNGLQNKVSPNLLYMKADDQVLGNASQMQAILNNPDFSLIIINDTIDDCQTLGDLQAKLKQMDQSLQMVHDICKNNQYTLFISSLYGINKEYVKDNFTKCKVDFSRKVPVIVCDEVYTKVNFRLDFGNIFTLANTIYTNMDLKYVGEVLIKKKSFLAKLAKK